MKKISILVTMNLVVFITLVAAVTSQCTNTRNSEIIADREVVMVDKFANLPDIYSSDSIDYDSFILVCEYLEIEYPEVVYTQAVLESGWFRSDTFKRTRNFLGLTNGRTGEYYEFHHWVDCLEGYRDMIQNQYNGGDYYEFLENLPYAMDKDYTKKLKQLENNINTIRERGYSSVDSINRQLFKNVEKI